MNPCYAIIPAAGNSRRMGQPKLLLPWPAKRQCSEREQLEAPSLTRQSSTQQKASPPSDARQSTAGSPATTPNSCTVIDRVLEAWTTSKVTETVVVIRRDDLALRDACRRWPVTIVHPIEATQDMKGSVCVGLRSLMERGVHANDAGFFIAPADLPGLTSQVIDGLIDAQTDNRHILLPRFGHSLDASVIGHPALLPWEWTREIFEIGPQEGVDSVVRRHPCEFVLFPPQLAASDIDTPAEYEAALRLLKIE